MIVEHRRWIFHREDSFRSSTSEQYQRALQSSSRNQRPPRKYVRSIPHREPTKSKQISRVLYARPEAPRHGAALWDGIISGNTTWMARGHACGRSSSFLFLSCFFFFLLIQRLFERDWTAIRAWHHRTRTRRFEACVTIIESERSEWSISEFKEI